MHKNPDQDTDVYVAVFIQSKVYYPDIDWSTWTTSKSQNHESQKFIDACSDTFLHQHVLEPTRYRHGQHQNVLDLILTNKKDMIQNIEYLPGIGISDHVCLLFTLQVYTTTVKSSQPRVNYHKGDYSSMKRHLSEQDWSEMANMTCTEAWIYFQNIFQKAVSKHIPSSVPARDKRKQLWMNRDAIILHKKKKDAWNHYKRTKDKHDYIRANQLKNDLSKLTRHLCREFEKDLARNMKTNPKAFWRYCNTKLKTKPRIGDLVNSEGQPTHVDLEKADILNKYFASVFTREDLASMPTLDNKHEDPQLRDIIIDEEIVKKKLLKLNSTKSAGPDGFHPRVLAETAGSIAKPLSIFRKSLDEGNLPMDWKVATVIPIHKKRE